MDQVSSRTRLRWLALAAISPMVAGCATAPTKPRAATIEPAADFLGQLLRGVVRAPVVAFSQSEPDSGGSCANWTYPDVVEVGGEPVNQWGCGNCGGTAQSPVSFVGLASQAAKSTTVVDGMQVLRVDTSHHNNVAFDLVSEYPPIPSVVSINPTGTPGQVIPMDLSAFHFHFPAEHLVPSLPLPTNPSAVTFELHMIGTMRGMTTTVVFGVIFSADTIGASAPPNEALDRVISVLENGPAMQVPYTFAPDLLGHFADQSYYAYSGSLTTPTCDPYILWFVLQKPIHVPMSQAVALRSALVAAGMVSPNERSLQAAPTTSVILVSPR